MTASRKQLLASLADQAVYSGSNVAFVLIVAQLSDSTTFGVFSIIYSVYVLVVGTQRALVTDPLLLTPRVLDGNYTEIYRQVCGASFSLGLVAALGLASSLWIDTWPRELIIAFAVCMPAFCLQDSYRAVAFFNRRPQSVLTYDAAWIGVQGAITLVLYILGELSSVSACWAWGLGASAAVVYAAVRTNIFPEFGGWRWVRDQRKGGLAMSAEYLSGQGSAQIAFLAVAGVLGPSGVASIRLVQVLLGPINLLTQGLSGWALPRLAARGPRARYRLGLAIAAPLAMAAICLTVAIALLPRGVLRSVAGPTWDEVGIAVILLIGAERAAAASAAALAWVGRSLGQTTALAWIRAAGGLVAIAAAPILANSSGATGACWGLLLSTSFVLMLFVRKARQPTRDT